MNPENKTTEFVQHLQTLSQDDKLKVLQSVIKETDDYLRWRLKAWIDKEPSPDLFTLLPPEIQYLILCKVDGSSLLKACQVNSEWYKIIQSFSHLWKKKCLEMGVNLKEKPSDVRWISAFSTSKKQLHHMESGLAFKEKDIHLQNCQKPVKVVDYNKGYLCAVSDDDSVNIWQLELNIPVLCFSAIQAVSCIKFQPKSTLICGHYTGILTSWDLSDMIVDNYLVVKNSFYHSQLYPRERSEFTYLKNKFKMHSGPVFSCDFSEELELVVSGSADESIKFWCLRTSDCLKTILTSTHWILKVILIPFSTNNLTHSVITMSRETVDKYQWDYEEQDPTVFALEYDDLVSQSYQYDDETHKVVTALRRGDLDKIRNVYNVQLNGDSDNFFITPGFQIGPSYVGLVQQDLQEKEATLRILHKDSFELFKELPINFKVRKLLAIGDRYALLLTVGKVVFTSTVVVVDFITGKNICFRSIPHSKMTTPDGAQITVGDTEWLDGLQGWDAFACELDSLEYSAHEPLSLADEATDDLAKFSFPIGGFPDHESKKQYTRRHIQNITPSNLILAAGTRDDVGRVFTLWSKFIENSEHKRKVE